MYPYVLKAFKYYSFIRYYWFFKEEFRGMSIEHIHFRNITLPVFVCISHSSEIHQQMTQGYKT